MTETKTAAQKKDEGTQSASSRSSSGKALEHIAEALKKIAERTLFLSESDQRDVADHISAAVAHSQGNAKDAKAAQERIAERNPEA